MFVAEKFLRRKNNKIRKKVDKSGSLKIALHGVKTQKYTR